MQALPGTITQKQCIEPADCGAATSTPQPEAHYTIQQAANALGIGSLQLFSELRARRILDNRNAPTWRYKEAGYLVEIERAYRHPIVGTRFYTRAIVTQRGIDWLRGLLDENRAQA